jgi:hypothetical protein
MKSSTATRILVLAAAALVLSAASTSAAALFSTFPGTGFSVNLPESASLVMLGTGLFALAGAVRRLAPQPVPRP